MLERAFDFYLQQEDGMRVKEMLGLMREGDVSKALIAKDERT